MITKLSKKIVDFFISCDNELENEKEIYIYGCEIIISTILNVLIVCICGVVMNLFFESILFFIVFAVIRSITGGYHANTYLKCNLILLIITLRTLVCIKIFYDNLNFIVIFGGICNLLMIAAFIKYAPLSNNNKQLSNEEKYYFKKKSVVLSLFISLTWGIMIHFNHNISLVISMGVVTSMLLLVIGNFICRKEVKNYDIIEN